MPRFGSFDAGSAGLEPTEAARARFERMRRLWAGPPRNVIPVSWPFAALVGRSDQAAVSVSGGQVYPNGIGFRLIAVTRQARGIAPSSAMGLGSRFPHDDPSELLRFGVRYADGRTAVNDSPHVSFMDDSVDEDQPRLLQPGGGGNETRFEQDMFLCPLPPDGPLELVCEWPTFNITESHTSVDVSGISAAAAETIELWPEEPDDERSEHRGPRYGEPGDGFFKPIIDDSE
jgi:hypothetical protein